MRARTREILAQLEAELDPDARLTTLWRRPEAPRRHRPRALGRRRVVIMDEPTAALSQNEIEELYALVER